MTPEKLAITFYNTAMYQALGEGDRTAIVIELTGEQKDDIERIIKRGYTLLSIVEVYNEEK